MRVETALRISDGTWQLGLVGTQTEKFRSVRLSAAELGSFIVYEAGHSYKADGALLRFGQVAELVDAGRSLPIDNVYKFPCILIEINSQLSVLIDF
jgi:hypothetical protein